MRAMTAVALLTILLLAGCAATTSTPDGPGTSQGVGQAPGVPAEQPPARLTLRGTVTDEAIRPLAANVTILELDQTVATGPSGAFAFPDLVPTIYFLRAQAPGYRTQTLSVEPAAADSAIRFVLEADPAATAYNVTLHFHGLMECAMESLIISPSCDTLVTFAGQKPVFKSNASFDIPLDASWRTVVADVVFDPAAQPGLDGLRVTARGTSDSRRLDSYEQYGRFNSSEPFTFRLEPGASYPDGKAPVPENATVFRFDVYPHSKYWHATCEPPGAGPCFLGAGAGRDVEFDLFLTIFYVAPAPPGFTLR